VSDLAILAVYVAGFAAITVLAAYLCKKYPQEEANVLLFPAAFFWPILPIIAGFALVVHGLIWLGERLARGAK
jgi:hypothetical protein